MRALIRRYLAVVYETLLMLALTLSLTALYYLFVGEANSGLKRFGLQVLLYLAMGAYFVRCWVASGQTLASQTWRLRVVSASGGRLTLSAALLRYAVVSVLLLPAGLTLWWALIDPEHCFLHDRLLGTRIVRS
ncbi:RDD family protein [Methylophilus aquaticus]|uniref:RDD family protein n=1 Tax=Methylophilus aquaticus TaxID=1971610 RepID=A0ABT9JSG6_9PROT|nr:RDD family protein [Methylophilus aquaticus]MDP8567055.1 RDD family protein [Methylophilus aquaticus]